MTRSSTPRIICILLLFASIEANCQWTIICSTGNGFVDNFDTLNSELYATGFFTTVCGVSNNHVAKYDGATWQVVGNGFPNAGHHLSNINNELYGVAYQPAVDSNWVYKFDGTNFNKLGEGVYLTTAVTGFSQTANIYNIVEYNGEVVACGEFDRVGEKQISGIMKWNGVQWDSLGSGLSGNIPSTSPIMYPHDMCLLGPDLIVSGNFRSAGGLVANGIARWDGTSWHVLGQGFNRTVYSVAVFNGELYAGGDFTMSGSTPLTYIAKWDGANWIDPGFSLYYANSSLYSFIHTLKVMNNTLFIGGGFDRAVFANDTMRCQAVAAFDGAMLDTLSGGLPGQEVEALAFFNGALYAGGGASNTNSFIAMYNIPMAASDMSRSKSSVTIYPNPTTSGFTIACDEVIDEIIVTNSMGQLIHESKPKQKQATLHIETTGLFFVTIKAGKSTCTRKIIVSQKG